MSKHLPPMEALLTDRSDGIGLRLRRSNCPFLTSAHVRRFLPLRGVLFVFLIPLLLLSFTFSSAAQTRPLVSTDRNGVDPHTLKEQILRHHIVPDHLKKFRSYEIVIPQRVDEFGIPFPKHRHYLRRKRSSETFNSDKDTSVWDTGDITSSSILYRLNAFGQDIHLRLSPDKDFIVGSLRVQHMTDNETWLGAELSESSRHCFHSGSVDQDSQSMAVLSTCESLRGMILSFNQHYFIEPLRNLSDIDDRDSESSANGIPHVIYKWTDTGSANYCHTKDSEEDAELLSAQNDWDGISEFGHLLKENHPTKRQKRSMSRERFVEVMVVADAEMKRFHGNDLEHYLLTLMAIVANIYRDHSIGNAINIYVVRIVVWESKEADQRISNNAATTLREFCKWQKDVNVANDDDPAHHDTAVLLTKHDICRSNQKCDTLGLAELGTMCDSRRSCSIVKDSGLSAAFTIAHELGHVFSLRHDDECPLFKNRTHLYHIMAPTLDHETKYWSWSECSRNKITEFIDAGNAECLNDKPISIKQFPVHEHHTDGILKLPGNVYTVDQQCAHIFEPKSVRCPYLPVCVRLWCTNPDIERVGCSTKHMPWADGTPCNNPAANESMWCIRGQCVLRKIPQPLDGQWGAWLPYGPCTRSCGGGIQQSTRECNNPVPENGGKYCMGRRVKYKSCNHMECPEGSVDFREEQCRSFNGQHFNINGLSPNIKWVAKYSGIESKDRCKLFCRDASSGAYYQLAERVIDGTKCSHETTDVCVMGQCRRAGCDNRLGSSTAKDNCGICGGDNSNCEQIKKEFPNNVNVTYGYNRVDYIPKGATNIDIRQYSPINTNDDDTYLALKNSSGDYILNGEFILSAFPKEVHLDRSILEYTGSRNNIERINGTGPLPDDLEVYVLMVGELLYKPDIKWQYTVRINISKPERLYLWSKTIMNWTNCSRLCQGKKVRKVVCVNTKTSAIVSDQHCVVHSKKPSDSVKTCHSKCRLRWKVVAESACSGKCQERGIINREFRCQKEVFDSSRVDNEQASTFVTDDFCQHINQPSATISCNGSCSPQWIYSRWSECSRPCGGGEQFRKVFCQDSRGQNLSDDMCTSLMLKNTSMKCNIQSCPHWVPRYWTSCSVTCGSGWRSREVDCIQGNHIVIRTVCNPSDEPENKTKCTVGPCPIWDVGKWGRCSATCGKGFQTREVKCQSAHGTVINEDACDAGTRPKTEATCRLLSCTTAISIILSTVELRRETLRVSTRVTLWRTGSWTECSASCGVGSRQRYVSCRDLDGNIAADSLCKHLAKPASIEQCSVRPCVQWRTGDWTHCSVTCGLGTETRYVACVTLEELEEQVLNPSHCEISVKPLTERMCNRYDCIPDGQLDVLTISSNKIVGTTIWRAGPWSSCSSTCGDGLQRRRVICQDEKGHSDNCDPDVQPPDQRSCNTRPCPQWNHGEWGQCDVTCGGGYQQRIVHCQLPSGDILPDAACLEFAPPQKQPCALDPCPVTDPSRSRWQKGRWSSCSVSCSKGMKQRSVVCIDDSGKRVADHLCKVQKPKATTWCRKGRCPFWWTSPWSECSAKCDAGVQMRTVLCMRGRNSTTESSLCQHLVQPENITSCMIRKCEPFYWAVGNWTECSQPCSFGIQRRNVSCIEMASEGKVDDNFCSESEKPRSEKDCSVVSCSNIWITSDWTRCSATCGQGLQKRAVSCRAMAREGWLLPTHVDLHACNQTERPSSERNCSYGNCASLYHWEMTSWSQCSKTCGFGRAYRESYCFDSGGTKYPLENCNSSLRPSLSRPCYMGPCYSTSCREVRQRTAWKADGEFNLLVHGKLLPIYCGEMSRSHPKEYISLVADENENYSEIYDKRLAKPNTCPSNETSSKHCQKCFRSNLQAAGLTKFSKVRLNITSLQIIGNDFTYSTTQGKRKIPFATAGDCYSRTGNCPQGKFQVMLTGTRFRVASNSDWLATGYKTVSQIDISRDQQIVRGQCGGHCGRCTPSSGFLQLEVLP